jgi:hypothetical protein
MGSLHSVGPWSLMQAALHGGAATWRPTMPWADGPPVCLGSAFAVTVLADRMSVNAARRYIFVIAGSISCSHAQDRPAATFFLAPELHLRKLTRSLEGREGMRDLADRR